MIFKNWLTDVNLVWQQVLSIASYFDEIKQKIVKKKIDKYTLANISITIQ